MIAVAIPPYRTGASLQEKEISRTNVIRQPEISIFPEVGPGQSMGPA